MNRYAKNVSMFFSYRISLSMFVILILVCGCTGIKTVGPDPAKSIDTPLTIGPKESKQENVVANSELNLVHDEKFQVESVKELNTDDALSKNKTEISSAASKEFNINTVYSVSVSARDKGIVVSALSDAPVNRYKTFTIKSSEKEPARFVTDIFKARTPAFGEIKIPVNQAGIERVRYCGYLNKVRIVIDTRDEYLSSYMAQPVSNGLEITLDSEPVQKPGSAKHNLDVFGELNKEARLSENTEMNYQKKTNIYNRPTFNGSAVENQIEFTGVPVRQSGFTEGEKRILNQKEMVENASLKEPRSKVRRYTGEKIALDFFETDIRNVFRILREVSDKNFAIDRDVTGTVTMTIEEPVPWDQVLDLVLTMNQLGKVEENNIIRIARMETITKENQDRQDQIAAIARLREEEKAVEPLMTEYFPINYSDASADILPKLQLLSTKDRGMISVDTRTNMVIMTDTAEKINHAREIIHRLDMVTPQVIIEARIVEVTSSFSKEIGIQWGLDHASSSSSLGGIWGFDTAVNLPVRNPAGTIGFDFSRISGSPLLIDARLSAAESQGEGNIISAPKVMTLNNKKAVIKQGREIPYTILDKDGVATTEFKEVDLRLEVTPHVTPDDRVSLNVFITKDEVAELVNDNIPSLSTKRAETELLVNDGETIVIGGILLSNEQKRTDSVPVLSKLPVLKWLFKRDINSMRKEELVIFLTPRIMRLEQKNV